MSLNTRTNYTNLIPITMQQPSRLRPHRQTQCRFVLPGLMPISCSYPAVVYSTKLKAT